MSKEPKTGIVHVIDAMKCELKDTSPQEPPRLTIALIVVNMVVFIMSLDLVYPLMGGLLKDLGLFSYLASPACIVSGGCLPQALLSMFIHAGLLHLIGNMFFLYLTGDNVEAALGAPKTLILYLASGLVGAAVEAFIVLDNIDKPALFMVGASAAVSGLIGAYLILYPGSTLCYCIRIPLLYVLYYCFRMKASNYLALWIMMQFVILSFTSHIAVWAHLAGLVTGLALARQLAGRERIWKLRIQLARGLYKGHRVDPGELRQPSISPLAQGLVVFSIAVILVALAYSIPRALEFEGMYYNVYARVDVYESERGTVYLLRDVEVRVEEAPPPGFYMEYDVYVSSSRGAAWAYDYWRGPPREYITVGVIRYELEARAVVALASYHLEHVAETAAATLTVVLTASLISMYAVLSKPEELEVTYLPEEHTRGYRDSVGLS